MFIIYFSFFVISHKNAKIHYTYCFSYETSQYGFNKRALETHYKSSIPDVLKVERDIRSSLLEQREWNSEKYNMK